MRAIRIIVLVGVLAALALLCGACGKRSQQTGTGISATPSGKASSARSLEEVLAEIDAYVPPPEVDRALFERMRAKVRKAVINRRGSKTSSDLDLDDLVECNKVNDLKRSSWQCNPVKLKWSYRNAGDYDQGGIVAIDDITPLAIHYGESVPDDDTIRELIDEDD